ncbi:hypothetical protein ADL00_42100 [Streptomyces sp. AS58]|uniref:Secreted protein n=1 Tax=Streptomyces cadmiisoli TaxID=2184053 RepID=A0A2Z4JDX7_9ACTN|nr:MULTISPECIES: hypothetical protein [Streptomyces]AWW43329.1 hypothetical protein DN051_42930 [Streptomyces cadmiisoli]KOV51115.1 hypothetical protein ADL00_42100 [Streptomyces sp. AS58]
MRRPLRARLAAAAVTAAAIGGTMIVAAPAAQAAPSDCTAYLASLGYSSTDTNLACTVGGSGLPADQLLCRILLMNVSSVPALIADNACRLAKA